MKLEEMDSLKTSNTVLRKSQTKHSKEVEELKNQLKGLQKLCKSKDDKHTALENDFKKLKARYEITSIQKMGPASLQLDTVAGVCSIRSSNLGSRG